tara:strand:+ start:4931 stop:5671 length:741 start_codon:yes stop_codon:yes gene_type:complete
MNMALEGKKVLLTGATGSLGMVIAKKLSEQGAELALSSTSLAKLEKLAKELGPKCHIFPCDLSTLSNIDKLTEQVTKRFDNIDVLINNAGIKKDDLLIRMKDDDWLNVININLNSYFKLTKNIAKVMFKQRSGKIISISSVVGFTGNPGQANYVASKSAVVGFTKSLAIELASRGVNVNCVAPGMIDSDMIDSLNDKQKENILSRIPMMKLGKPEDIANGCIFLASKESDYITGQTLHINGGLSMI